MQSIKALYSLLILFAALPAPLYAQMVIHAPDTHSPLAERWQWALQADDGFQCREGCWIGYSIQRLMDPDSYIGSWNSDDEKQIPLGEMLYGKHISRLETETNGKVSKPVALLFRLNQDRDRITAVKVSNLSRPVSLHAPLLWLGRSADAPSVNLIKKLYAETSTTSARKDLVMAAALHDSQLAVPFLAAVLNSRAATEIREAAAFWLGEQNEAHALTLLTQVARQDKSEDVREKAVFAISLMTMPAATDTLIELAKHADHREVREKALFWLAQHASKKAVATLEHVAENDPDAEIRKKAVFALSQLPADQAVPRLIKLARSSQDPGVRKQAIFWLGQSGDPRAVDVLASIAKGH